MIGSRSTTTSPAPPQCAVHCSKSRMAAAVPPGSIPCTASTGSIRWMALGSRRAIPAAAVAKIGQVGSPCNTNVGVDTAAISAVGRCRSVVMTASYTADWAIASNCAHIGDRWASLTTSCGRPTHSIWKVATTAPGSPASSSAGGQEDQPAGQANSHRSEMAVHTSRAARRPRHRRQL